MKRIVSVIPVSIQEMKALHTVHTVNVFPGVELTCIQTDKFKTDSLSINLISGLSRDTAAHSALLPRVLRRGSKYLPDMEQISGALDNLYGARVEPIIRKKGELHCIGFHVDFPDGRFISESQYLLEETVSLAGGILLSPDMRDGLLRQDYVDSEKKNLIDDIRSIINDKRSYAVDRLLEEMCSEEAYSIHRLGRIEEAQTIDTHSLTQHYHQRLSDSKIEIYYCGANDPSRVKAAIESAFSDLSKQSFTVSPQTDIILYPPNDAPKRVSEALDVTQGKLVVGFRLGKAMSDNPDYPAMMLFNAIYGSGVTSKLFVNVREKLALCYYASSMLDKHKGIMLVSSGVEFANFEIALEEILTQLDHVKNGKISEEEMRSAKSGAITSIRSSMDRPSGLLELYFDGSVSAMQYDPDKLCEKIEAVTISQIIDTASEISTDTIYFLTGEEDDGSRN